MLAVASSEPPSATAVFELALLGVPSGAERGAELTPQQACMRLEERGLPRAASVALRDAVR